MHPEEQWSEQLDNLSLAETTALLESLSLPVSPTTPEDAAAFDRIQANVMQNVRQQAEAVSGVSDVRQPNRRISLRYICSIGAVACLALVVTTFAMLYARTPAPPMIPAKTTTTTTVSEPLVVQTDAPSSTQSTLQTRSAVQTTATSAFTQRTTPSTALNETPMQSTQTTGTTAQPPITQSTPPQTEATVGTSTVRTTATRPLTSSVEQGTPPHQTSGTVPITRISSTTPPWLLSTSSTLSTTTRTATARTTTTLRTTITSSWTTTTETTTVATDALQLPPAEWTVGFPPCTDPFVTPCR